MNTGASHVFAYLMVPVMQNVSPDKWAADEDTAEAFLFGGMLFVCLFGWIVKVLCWLNVELIMIQLTCAFFLLFLLRSQLFSACILCLHTATAIQQ